jgi:D-alanyl-D-alanine carboxypeptidase
MIQTTICAALCGLVLFCVTQAAAHADSIDDCVRNSMQKRHVPGVSIAIVHNGKVVRARGYGLANVELAVPATENTAYQLASVTKQFTATAIMMLVEEGKLSLDDHITQKLPDLPAAWDAVTVRNLLNHTSGIKSYTSTKDFNKTMRKDFGQRELLDLVTHEPMDFAPGEKWSYDNTGYFLLGMLIEKVTGKAYGEFLDERIFKPLGMSHTRVNDLQVIIPNRAHGYSWDGATLRNGEYVSPTQPFAAGALVSTVSDLIKWDAALTTDRLLKKSSLEQMWTATKLGNGETADYGFGWQVERVNGHRLIGHGGGIPGFATFIARFVDDKLTVIVLCNGDSGDPALLARDLAGCVVPSLARQAEQPIADIDPQTTERLKTMIQDAAQGKPDLDLFTAEMKQARAAHIQEEQAHIAALGHLKALQLLERKTIEPMVQLRYRAVFEKGTLTIIFVINKEGKIAGARLEPEE